MFIFLTKLFSCTSFLLLSILIVLLFLWKNGRMYYLAWKLPGGMGYPIVGHAPYFMNKNMHLENIYNLFGTLNSFGRIWLGPIPCVVIAKPDHLQKILNSQYCIDRPFITNKLGEDVFEKGLTTQRGNTWKLHRRLLSPAFSQKMVDSFFDIFCEQTDILLKCFEKHIGEGEFDMLDPLKRYSLDVICETSMGTKMDVQTTESKFFHNVIRLAELTAVRITTIWLLPNLFWNLSSNGREFKRLKDEVQPYLRKIIQTKQDEYKERKDKLKQGELADFNNEPQKKKTFIDILFEAEHEKNFDSTEILHEITTIISAGIDTISVSTAYCLLALAMNPKIQDKVVEELEDVFGRTKKPITLDDISKLTYLERTYKEALRYFPPLPLILRDIGEEIVLDGFTVPKHIAAILSFRHLHTNPDLWPDPDIFDPDRFKPEECAKRHPYSFLPFSAGPRNCIGIRYTYVCEKVLLASILRKYKISTNIKQENIKYIFKLTALPIGGFQMSLDHRYE